MPEDELEAGPVVVDDVQRPGPVWQPTGGFEVVLVEVCPPSPGDEHPANRRAATARRAQARTPFGGIAAKSSFWCVP